MSAPRDNSASPSDADLTPRASGDAASIENHTNAVLGGTGGPSGIRVGRYTLGSPLGAGGMGTVFAAQQDEPQRTVALKLMNGAIVNESARKRFKSEAEKLGRLRHPHIAQVYESGTHERDVLSIPYFAMEIVPGGRAITAFAREQQLSIGKRLELMSDAADAVQHAHEQGVIHRDLKPSNVLVDKAGFVKVIDFGLARLIDEDENGKHTITLASDDSSAFGTPQYMSPEQFNRSSDGSAEPIDEKRCDVYALGVILYEILCGRLPFVAPKARDLASTLTFARVVLETEPTTPRALNRALTEDTQAVILKCLEKDPQRRYASAADLASDLRRALAGELVHARRASVLYRIAATARVRSRRNPIATLLFVATLCVVASEQVGGPIDDFKLRSTFERTALTSPTLQHFDANATLAKVRLIAVDPQANWRHLAELAGVKGDEATSPKAIRAIHGKMMERLAKAQVKLRVLAFDLYFPNGAKQDATFVNGVTALAHNGVGVVVGTKGWDISDANRSDAEISPAINASVASGGLTLWLTAENPWSLQAFWKRGSGAPRVSLPLAAAARALCPPASPPPAYELAVGAVEVHGWGSANWRVPITGAFRQPRETEFLQRGDVVASYFLEMPATHVLDSATVSYERVLTATDAELHEWFEGRAVMVADFRPGADPLKPYVDGRTLRASYAMLVALERLLADAPIRRYPSVSVAGALIDGKYAADILAAAVGCALGYATWRRTRTRLGTEVVALSLLLLWSFVAYRTLGILNSPTTTCLVLVFTAEGSAAARRLARPLYE